MLVQEKFSYHYKFETIKHESCQKVFSGGSCFYIYKACALFAGKINTTILSYSWVY